MLDTKNIYSLLESRKLSSTAQTNRYLHDNLMTLISGNKSKKLAPIKRMVSSANPSKILDIGCGYGAFALFYALQGISSVGIDLQEDALDAAKAFATEASLNNVSFHAMDACHITLSGFDVAVSADFYEHLPYDAQVSHLKSVHSALTDKGVYVIRAPHKNNIRQQIPGHIGLPSYALLEEQAHEAGFTLRFTIAHTGILTPIQYHTKVERWILEKKWSDKTTYKTLQKFGLANVIACLKKRAQPHSKTISLM